MKKLITLMMLATAMIIISCSSDDAAPVANEVLPEVPQQRSYKMFPCVSNPAIVKIPAVHIDNLVLKIKRASGGDWIQYPITSYNRVFNNDSVWFQITDATKYFPNENNYLAFQIFNRDTVSSSNQNHYIKFESFDAPVNQKLKVTFQEYY